MNPLTPGPPPPMPGHHQSYHQNYYQPPPPPPAPPPVHHGPPVTQPCFNCGATNHWAQQCPEPRRNMPAGAVQQKPRNRGSKSGPGPIITRYPPPQPQYYPSHPYPTPPQVQSPGGPPYQQAYGAPYGAPPPPPPPPHPMPPQQNPGQHYGVPPPPQPSAYPPYPAPVNAPYQQPPPYSPASYPPQAPPPPVPPPPHHHHHQQPPYYPHPQHQTSPTFRTPLASASPYQFYNQPPTPSQSYPIPSQRSQGRHRQHSTSQQHPPTQQRNSISEPSGPSTGSGPIIWRPAQHVERPLATTLEETEQAEEQGLTGFENPNGTISKYWNPGGKRTKAHPKLSELRNDPVLKSIHGGCRVIERDFFDSEDSQDTGRDDVAMELANSDDGKPDVMDKLSGVLSRQSSEPGSDFRAPVDGEYGRRKSLKCGDRKGSRDEDRKNSRDAGVQSPRRDRSKSPSNEDSSYGSYRSRTPSGGASVKKNRTQHQLPTRPDPAVDTTMKSPPKPADRSSIPSSTDYSPIKPKEETRSRSRSASPSRRNSEDDNRRHRDYDVRAGDIEKSKTAKDSKKRRTSGANGVPAVFGRRW